MGVLEKLKTSKGLAQFIAKCAIDKKGKDVDMLDLRKVSSLVDYFVIVTGTSDVHSKAIADEIIRKLKKEGIRNWHLEGNSYGHWILIDYVDVVAHIFLEEERNYYNLQSVWGDAPQERIEEKHGVS